MRGKSYLLGKRKKQSSCEYGADNKKISLRMAPSLHAAFALRVVYVQEPNLFRNRNVVVDLLTNTSLPEQTDKINFRQFEKRFGIALQNVLRLR